MRKLVSGLALYQLVVSFVILVVLFLHGCGSASNTTQTNSDGTAPSAPSGLTASAASTSQINVSWAASTDNLGVTAYRVERCTGPGCSSFAQIGTTSGALTFSDTGLAASTSYSYRARAADAAGNLSNYSNTSSATTAGSGGTNIVVSVSPSRGGITTSQSLSVTATLTNDSTNAGATWSSSDGGSFSPNPSTTGTPVKYTPAGSAGLVTITATSVADGAKSATATIGVTDLKGVTTYLNGNARQGANTQEYALATTGPTAVNSTNFGKLFSCTVDAAIYAQPLWLANVSVSGTTHNVVYVATQHNTLYAFDADSSSCTNVWGSPKSLNPSGQTWVTSGNVSCTDIQPDIGVVGTPVIDSSSSTIYVVTKSKETSSTTYHQFLHALDLATGAEKFSGPVEIAATVLGTGDGSAAGSLTFDALTQNQRPALLLVNGHIIITWASHCDIGPYHGWVMSYHVSSSVLAQEAVINLSPNGINGGIWMSGSGPAADASGNIYLALGNGTFDANSGGSDYGDAIVKLGPPSGQTFSIQGYFRSTSLISPNSVVDKDQGSGGVMLFPTVSSHNYLTQAGKDGNVYVLDQSNLGGLGSGSNAVQFLSNGLPQGLWGSPTYWDGSTYFGPSQNGGGAGVQMLALSFDGVVSALLSTSASSHSSHIFNYPGPTAPISSSGTSNGIVWALDNSQWETSCSSTSTCQTIYAYDATNLGTLLYSNGGTNTGAGAVKFTVPTVANGKVYVGGQNTLTVYGLLP